MTCRLINIPTAFMLGLLVSSTNGCTRTASVAPALGHTQSSHDPPRFRVSVQELRGGTVYEKHGFIDATGKVVIPPVFAGADDFSEGLAHVWVGHRHAYIDTAGAIRFYLPPDCTSAGPFSEGLALVSVSGEVDYEVLRDGRWGYVDRSGQFAVPARFTVPLATIDWTEIVSEFSEGGGHGCERRQ